MFLCFTRMSLASFVLALSMMLSSGAVGFRRLFMVLSGHVVLIFWHYFTSPFEIDRVNMNLMLCPGLLGQSGALYGSTPCTSSRRVRDSFSLFNIAQRRAIGRVRANSVWLKSGLCKIDQTS